MRLTHALLLSCALLTFAACSKDSASPDIEQDEDLSTVQRDMNPDLTAPDLADEPDQQRVSQDMPPDLNVTEDMAPTLAARVFASFSTLDTLAGTAKILDGGVSGWQPSFEGGRALDAELSRPHMALADSRGNVYIADKDAHAIRKVTPEGIITTFAGTSVAGNDGDGPTLATSARLSSPNGLWIAADDTVYIYDYGNDRVTHVDAQGMMRKMFEVGGSGAGRGLWVSDDGALAYVSAGTQLKKWSKNEGLSILASGFSSLGNLHVSPDGKLGLTDRGSSRAYLIDRESGEKTHIAGVGSGKEAVDGMRALDAGLDEVRGIWFHPEGGYFLATHKGGQVWFVDEQGLLHRFLHGDTDEDHAGDGERFDTPGKKISEPRAVTMTPAGEVLVTEHDGGYIRIVHTAN